MRLIKKRLFISLLLCSNFLLPGEIKNHYQVKEAIALFFGISKKNSYSSEGGFCDFVL